MTTTSKLGLYIHIPFCRQKCAYCDFLSFPCASTKVFSEYVRALSLEMKTREEDCSGFEIDSVFIGGGTPSLLPAGDFSAMMDALRSSFRISKDAEITAESNPASLTQEKLETWIMSGVNRLSIGIQSFDNATLRTLGRIHDKNDALNKIQLARKCGFTNINIDLMFGVPGQSVKTWRDTLRQGIFLRPQHISLYSLQLEEGTPLYEQVYKEKSLTAVPEIIDREMYHTAIGMLRDAGYSHYEISNAALPGMESRHNRKYWSYEEYLGLGLGASSFFRGKRFRNHTRMIRYLDELKKNRCPVDAGSIEQYTERDEMGIFVFTGLRKAEGVDLKLFRKLFGMDLFSVYDPAILGRYRGLLNIYEDHLYLTEAGMDISNRIMAEFV